jgi:hypothetical protein
VTAAAKIQLSEAHVVVLFVLAGLASVPLAARAPVLVAAAAVGGVLLLVAVLRPAMSVVGYVVAAPLVTGLGRGAVLPGLRLNEALLLVVVAGVTLSVLASWRSSGCRWPQRLHPLDVAIVAAAATSSVTPLLWMYARSRPVAVDDLLYAVALWKLVVVYAAVRLVVRGPRWAETALVMVLGMGCVVGVIGVLQAFGVGPVIDFLSTYVSEEEGGYELDASRAMSTLGHPIAYADVLVFGSVAAAALALRVPHHQRMRWCLSALLAIAALASGQFSAIVALLVAVTAFGLLTGTARKAFVSAAALGLLAIPLLQPVLAARTQQLDRRTGLPSSWVGPNGRLTNLQQYFWPEIGTDYNWLFGVQTSSRVPGDESWQGWVYIESGYTWALWNGGLPLLLSVLVLIYLAWGAGRRLSRSADPVEGTVGTAVATIACVLAVLMLLDPHLTLRGAGDVLFLVLGLAANLDRPRSAGPPGPGPEVSVTSRTDPTTQA